MWLFYFMWLIRLVQCLSFSLMSTARLMCSATSAEGRPLEFCFHWRSRVSNQSTHQPAKTETFSVSLNKLWKRPVCMDHVYCYLPLIFILQIEEKTSPALVLESCMKLFLMSGQTSICIWYLFNKLRFPLRMYNSNTYKCSLERLKELA